MGSELGVSTEKPVLYRLAGVDDHLLFLDLKVNEIGPVLNNVY